MQTTGGGLSAAVDAAVAVPVADLCASELQARIAGVSREAGRLAGWVSLAVGQLTAMTGGVVEEDGRGRTVSGWLAEATRTSTETAGSRIRTAEALRSLPLVAAAVVDGVVTPEAARVLTRLVGKIDAGALRHAEPELISVASELDPVQLARYVAHLIATHCEPALEAEEKAGHNKRYLQSRTTADGGLAGSFRLAAGDAEAFLTAVEALARRQGLEDGRSAGQRRADALVELAEQALRHAELPDHGGQRPQLSYVLPADWAARQAQRATCPTCSTCPQHRPPNFTDTVLATAASAAARDAEAGLATGAGRGTAAGRANFIGSTTGTTTRTAIPAEHGCAVAAWTGPATRTRIEAILCDARITRVLLDAHGQVRGLQTLSDSVTPSQRRALAARDLGCAARGCTRPPAMCDAHHLVHLEHGGTTILGNLVLLCRRHHLLWHDGKITLHDLVLPWHPINATSTGPPGG